MASIFDWSVTAGSNDSADTDINWLEGQFGQTVNNSARAMMAKVAAMIKLMRGAYTTTNVGNDYSIAIDFTPSTLAKGFIGVIRFNAGNTGAVTLTNGALAAAAVKNAVGTALGTGEIVANGLYLVVYDTVAAEYRIVSKLTAAVSGNLTASGYQVSATDKLLGRVTAGTGAIEEIGITDFVQTLLVAVDASAFRTLIGTVAASDTVAGIVELLTVVELLTGTDTTRTPTAVGIASLWKKAANIAGAGTITFLDDGGYVNITGSGWTCTDFDFTTATDGRTMKCRATGTGSITHNATTLICPGGANITVAAGDTWEVIQDAADNVIIFNYQKANGTALVVASSGITLVAEVATTSGTTINFGSIPAGVKRITVMLKDVSAGSSTFLLQLGDSGGIENTNYSSSTAKINSAAAVTVPVIVFTGFIIAVATGGGQSIWGQIILTRQNATHTWQASWNIFLDGAGGGTPAIHMGGGTKTLSAELTQLELSGGTFDNGTMSIAYES